MLRPAVIRSGLVIGLTLLALGSITTASKAGSPQRSTSAQVASDEPTLPASSAEQLAVSRHLKAVGALFYGAWWCPACSRQKALFGQQGAQELPYVECDKAPKDRDRCIAAKIEAFPTWVLQGKERLVGVQSLDELKKWSGYAR
ncbi:MAG: hypothetical protein FJ077_06695 [Cyanobacteria bacterium K_DeepCast_35m_m2_023]|nr:hypothetical protein [Cyanobacteria bacterium K_DeepCast_35m_m2_023]